MSPNFQNPSTDKLPVQFKPRHIQLQLDIDCTSVSTARSKACISSSSSSSSFMQLPLQEQLCNQVLQDWVHLHHIPSKSCPDTSFCK
eukprot:5216393-Amphidinium_carterae.1